MYRFITCLTKPLWFPTDNSDETGTGSNFEGMSLETTEIDFWSYITSNGLIGSSNEDVIHAGFIEMKGIRVSKYMDFSVGCK